VIVAQMGQAGVHPFPGPLDDRRNAFDLETHRDHRHRVKPFEERAVAVPFLYDVKRPGRYHEPVHGFLVDQVYQERTAVVCVGQWLKGARVKAEEIDVFLAAIILDPAEYAVKIERVGEVY